MDKDNKTSEKKNKSNVKNLTRMIIIAAVVFVVLVAAVIFLGNKAYNRAIIAINSAHIEELANHDVKIINSSISFRVPRLFISLVLCNYMVRISFPISNPFALYKTRFFLICIHEFWCI